MLALVSLVLGCVTCALLWTRGDRQLACTSPGLCGSRRTLVASSNKRSLRDSNRHVALGAAASVEARLAELEAENSKLRTEIQALKTINHFNLAVLGDLHLDPQKMDAHHEAQQHLRHALSASPNPMVISVGDLGDKPSSMIYPGGVKSCAGSTVCFEHAKEFFANFGVSYDLITGNHDLEAMKEFSTDAENLAAWMRIFGKSEPYFAREVAHLTLLVGLSTTRFRGAQGSSHEVHIDDVQLDWFERTLKAHPASQGWKVLVFTHAPPMGSGVRALQSVHIKNGCAWLNHAGDATRRHVFLRLVRENSCVRAWFSGHFHLSHDYEDSISFPHLGTGDNSDQHEGHSSETWPKDGRCLFVQLGVIGESSQRDGRRQTRIVRGNSRQLEIYTINHHEGGRERLDAVLTYGQFPDGHNPHYVQPWLQRKTHPEDIKADSEQWFSALTPQPDDGCHVQLLSEASQDSGLAVTSLHRTEQKVCWWHMADGAVLGVHDNMLIEYDATTLSPLGVVVEALDGREVVVIGGGQAVLLATPFDGDRREAPEVIHPNEDGSYWRRFQKNKLYRTKCKEREKLAKAWWSSMQEASS